MVGGGGGVPKDLEIHGAYWELNQEFEGHIEIIFPIFLPARLPYLGTKTYIVHKLSIWLLMEVHITVFLILTDTY